MGKQIKLTQGKVALVDSEDFERINKHKWCARKERNGKFYALRGEGCNPEKTIYMHREILCAPNGVFVDHIRTSDTLNNKKSNLRLCNRSGNGQNRGKLSNNTSGYKGVSWRNSNNRWSAEIRIADKQIFLGFFDDAKQAAKVYDEAARKYHGEFAKTNFK